MNHLISLKSIIRTPKFSLTCNYHQKLDQIFLSWSIRWPDCQNQRRAHDRVRCAFPWAAATEGLPIQVNSTFVSKCHRTFRRDNSIKMKNISCVEKSRLPVIQFTKHQNICYFIPFSGSFTLVQSTFMREQVHNRCPPSSN